MVDRAGGWINGFPPLIDRRLSRTQDTAMRMAQYGTGHGHAAGKMLSMRTNADVEVAGIFEPDLQRREANSGLDAYRDLLWFDTEDEMLGDDSIRAVASEGTNAESLGQTERIVGAGKHVWYDKPAGYDWNHWQRVIEDARQSDLLVQMGYMFRYHPGFCQVADWARSGFLGQLFSIRAHMSTFLSGDYRESMSAFAGGICYDLAGHVLDQIVWLLGRPHTVASFLRNDTGDLPSCVDNTLAVFEFDSAMAFIDIAAMETPPTARRFEVYGTRGSAIISEPFEPGDRIRLCLQEAGGGFEKGEQVVEVETTTRQDLYDLELVAFLEAVAGERQPDRSHDHELLMQETLLRAAGELRLS